MGKNTKYGIVLIGALSLMILSTLVLSASQDNIKLTNNPSQGSTKLSNNADERLWSKI
jgi:cytochrome c-type biogenesis protein CcmE